MLKANEILNKMEELSYWDAKVLNVACDHFADEVTLTYEDSDGDVSYKFLGCYSVNIEHVVTYEKRQPLKELESQQIYFFLQDVEIEDAEIEGVGMYTCKINAFPLRLEVRCTKIEIERTHLDAN